MIAWFSDLPWGWGALLVGLLAAVIWLTDWLAWHKGRLFGLHEADRRNQQQLRHDYVRGVYEGVRRSARWLADNGRQDEAECLPRHLLSDRQHPTDQP